MDQNRNSQLFNIVGLNCVFTTFASHYLCTTTVTAKIISTASDTYTFINHTFTYFNTFTEVNNTTESNRTSNLLR